MKVHVHVHKSKDAGEFEAARATYERLQNELRNIRQRFLKLADEGAKTSNPDAPIFANARFVAKKISEAITG